MSKRFYQYRIENVDFSTYDEARAWAEDGNVGGTYRAVCALFPMKSRLRKRSINGT